MDERKSAASRCAGVVATACTQGKRTQHGKPPGVVRDDQPDAREGQTGRLGGGGEARSTDEAEYSAESIFLRSGMAQARKFLSAPSFPLRIILRAPTLSSEVQ